jgi:hypothetical protein
MKPFFSFGGRGTPMIPRDSIVELAPDAGVVLLVTQRLADIDFSVGYCRSAIVERWGVYCFGNFRRVSSPDLRRSWAAPCESDLMIYRAVDVHLVPEEPWMNLRK